MRKFKDVTLEKKLRKQRKLRDNKQGAFQRATGAETKAIANKGKMTQELDSAKAMVRNGTRNICMSLVCKLDVDRCYGCDL